MPAPPSAQQQGLGRGAHGPPYPSLTGLPKHGPHTLRPTGLPTSLVTGPAVCRPPRFSPDVRTYGPPNQVASEDGPCAEHQVSLVHRQPLVQPQNRGAFSIRALELRDSNSIGVRGSALPSARPARDARPWPSPQVAIFQKSGKRDTARGASPRMGVMAGVRLHHCRTRCTIAGCAIAGRTCAHASHSTPEYCRKH